MYVVRGLTVVVAAYGLVEGREFAGLERTVVLVGKFVDLEESRNKAVHVSGGQLLRSGPIRSRSPRRSARRRGGLITRGMPYDKLADGPQEGVQHVGGGLVGFEEVPIIVVILLRLCKTPGGRCSRCCPSSCCRCCRPSCR